MVVAFLQHLIVFLPQHIAFMPLLKWLKKILLYKHLIYFINKWYNPSIICFNNTKQSRFFQGQVLWMCGWSARHLVLKKMMQANCWLSSYDHAFHGAAKACTSTTGSFAGENYILLISRSTAWKHTLLFHYRGAIIYFAYSCMGLPYSTLLLRRLVYFSVYR